MGRNTIWRSVVIALLVMGPGWLLPAQPPEARETLHVPAGRITIGYESLSHPAVRSCVEQFRSASGLRGLASSLNQSLPFYRHIMDTLRNYGLPEQLFFVALIESGFDPFAVSRSGAVGIWQFMDHSVEDWMVITSDVDERRDFYRATLGAAEKLLHNFTIFEDWLLAIASYNAGVGHIQRAMEASGALTFWELLETDLLPDQTRSYVPRFVAVSHVASQAARHGLSLPWSESPEWVRLGVPARTSLSQLSQRSGVPAQQIMDWNPHIIADIHTDGLDSVLHINIPDSYRHYFTWLSD